MSNYKEIYDQFYNSDPEFQSTFADFKSFESYVDNNDEVIENLKEVYNFNEQSNPTQGVAEVQNLEFGEEVKKKEISPSDLNLPGDLPKSPSTFDNPIEPPKKNIFGSLFRKEEKVSVAVPSEPNITDFKTISDSYENLQTEKEKGVTNEQQLQMILDDPINFIQMKKFGLMDVADEAIKKSFAEKQFPLESQMQTLTKRALTGVSDESGAPYISTPLIEKVYNEQNKNGELIKTYKFNEANIKSFLVPEKLTAMGLGDEEVKYNMRVDEDKLEEYAKKTWEEFQQGVAGEEDANWKSWEVMKNTKTGEIFKSTIRQTILDGYEQIEINKEIDAESLKQFGVPFDDLDDEVKKSVSGFRLEIDKQIKLEKDRVTEAVVRDLTEKSAPLLQEMQTAKSAFEQKYQQYYNSETDKYDLNISKKALDDFKNKYSKNFNAVKNSYAFSSNEEIAQFEQDRELVLTAQKQEQVIIEQYNKDVEALTELISDRNKTVDFYTNESQNQLVGELKNVGLRYQKMFDEKIKSVTDNKFAQDKINKVVKQGIDNYFSKKGAETEKAKEQISYGDKFGALLSQSTWNTIAGLGSMLENTSVFDMGGKGNLSTWFSALGEYANLYDAQFVAPSVLKSKTLADGTIVDESLGEFIDRITTTEGFAEMFKDFGLLFAQNAVPLSTTVAVGMATRGMGLSTATTVGLSSTIGFVTDTGMEMSEIRKQVLEKTGSITKAQEAEREKFTHQIGLFYTYLIEGGILFGKLPIKNVYSAVGLGTAKLVADATTETVFQEGPQNYATEKIIHELENPDKPFTKKLSDYINLKTALDVAGGSFYTNVLFSARDSYRQIRAEKIKDKTLASLEKKGLAAYILSLNKDLGKDAALSAGFIMHLKGRLTKQEYSDFVTTIQRINEFDEVASRQNIPDATRIAVVDKMLQRAELTNQKETAETQEKKDLIDADIKKLDQQITDLQDKTKESKITSIVNFKTGRVIYATDDETAIRDIITNPNFTVNLIEGIREGVFVMNTENQRLRKAVDQSVNMRREYVEFSSEREKIVSKYDKIRAKATKDRLANKKNTLSDAQIQEEFKKEIDDLVEKYGMEKDIAPETNKATRREDSIDNRVASETISETPAQISIPQQVGKQTQFDAETTDVLDLFIEANKQNPIAYAVLNDLKVKRETFKKLFPQGKIYYHTSQDSYTKAFNETTNENLSQLTDDGFFAHTENGEIHINLTDPTRFNKMNQDVVAHEIFHGVLLQAFGKKIYSAEGKFVKWEIDDQALNDMKAVIQQVVGRYGTSLDTFLGNRSYQDAETTEEFLVQLGAMLSRANPDSALEQGFVARILAAISKFVKDKMGIDVFAFYSKQADAIEFFNYIGSQLGKGATIDESKFTKIRGDFMVSNSVDMAALSEGNIEPGTVIGYRRSSEDLNPFLNQFTKRIGTTNLALNLPVKTLKQAVTEHNGAVLLIMSDNTGFFVDEESGEFVMGGYGYMAAKKNVEEGIGFSSVNLSTISTTMTNATACNEGKPVLALIVLSSPKAALGNYYALKYTFGSLPNILNTQIQAEEYKQSLINVIRNKTELLDAFETDSKLIKQRKKASNLMAQKKKEGLTFEEEYLLIQQLNEISRKNFDSKFLPFFNSVDFSNVDSVNAFISDFISPKYSFPQRQGIIDSILPSHENLSMNKSTPLAKRILAEAGMNQITFYNRFGEPQFVGDRLSLKGPEVVAPWGSVFGGFTIDPKADILAAQKRGLSHPQFDAKLPGYNHFLLDGEYAANDNFYEALAFGTAPIDKMATQGIQPGTRLPMSNKDPNALTSQQRREMLLEREFTPAVRRSVAENMQVMESFAEQFSKRLGVPYEFYHDENDNRIWYRKPDGTFMMNTANATVNTPIYAYSGAFLEILRSDNLALYTELVRGLLRDKKSEFYGDLEKEFKKAVQKSLKELLNNNTIDQGDFDALVEKNTLDKHINTPISEYASSPNLLPEFSINNNILNGILEEVLLNHFGRIAIDEYDLKTGVYKALEKIWNEILKIIKQTFAFNKIEVEKIVFPSVQLKDQMMTPLEYLAKQFADPRNEFLRDPSFAANKPKSNASQELQVELIQFQDSIQNNSSPFGENVSMTSTGDVITNYPVRKLAILANDLINNELIQRLGSFTRLSQVGMLRNLLATKKVAIEGETDSFEDYFMFGGFEVSSNALLDSILDIYDETFKDDLRGQSGLMWDFRTMLMMSLEYDKIQLEILQRIDDSGKLSEFQQQLYYDSYTDGTIPWPHTSTYTLIDNISNVFRKSTSVFNLINLATEPRNSQKVFLGHQRVLNSTYILDADPREFIENQAYFEFQKRFLKNIVSQESIDFINQLAQMNNLDDKINGTIASSLPVESHYVNMSQLSAAHSRMPEQFIGSIGVRERNLQELIDDLNSSSINNIDRYSSFNTNSGSYDFKKGTFEIFHPESNSVLTMEVTTKFDPSTRDVNISFMREGAGYHEVLEWGPQIQVLFTNIVNKVYSLHQNERVESISFTPASDPIDKNTGQRVKTIFPEPTFELLENNAGGARIKVTTKKPHNLVVLDSLEVKNSSERNANGSSFYVESVISPTQFVYTTIDKLSGTPKGGEIITPRNLRRNLYNIFAKKLVTPYHVVPDPRGTRIILPALRELNPAANAVMPLYHEMKNSDVDPIHSTVAVRRSRAETLGKDAQTINAEYERMQSEGKTQEQILGNLFSRFSYESMRASQYSPQFQNFYDEYVTKKAKESWGQYSENWNKRKGGIIDFVDKYVLEASLMDIITALRQGVRFVDVEDKLIAEGGSQAMVVADMATQYNPSGEKVSFSDLEIYSALFEYGIPQNSLNQLFGTNYRQTIDNLLLDEEFDAEIKQNLTDDARAQKISLSFSELEDLSEQLGIMPSTAILSYINKHLSIEKGSPLIPAVKAIVDKINEQRSLTDVADEFGKQVELIGDENIQALAELGTAAGRILRILRELKKNKAEVIIEAIKESKIKVTPAFEQEIKNAFSRLDNARNAFEQAKETAIKDFTDQNIQALQKAEDALIDAEYKIAMIMADPRLQFRFAADVYANRIAMSLLNPETAVLSRFANIETLIEKFGLNRNIVQKFLEGSVNAIKSDVFKKGKASVFQMGRQDFRNLRLAHTLSVKRTRQQVLRTLRDGNIPYSAQSKFFENVASVNSFRDAKNLAKLTARFIESYKTKNKLNDMEFADIMQVMLYEHAETGKIMLADNKAYSILGASVRALMQPQEVMSRLMALGMDKYTANLISKKALLDFVSMRSAMENSELPEGLIDELVRRGSISNDAQTTVPFVQSPKKPVFYMPGSNPQVELKNLTILMDAIFRDEQNMGIEREGLRATFYAENAFASNLIGGLRKKLRQGMISTYLDSLEAKAEGATGKKYAYRGANALVQMASILQYTVFPFVKVPSNILIQIAVRTNPLGAILNSVWHSNTYYKNLDKFYKKYKIGKYAQTVIDLSSQPTSDISTERAIETTSERLGLPFTSTQSIVTTNKGVDVFDEEDFDSPRSKDNIRKAKKKLNTQQKIELEKDLANLASDKRRYINALADVIKSTEFLAVVGGIAATGAVFSHGEPPEEKRAMKKIGVSPNDWNISYYIDYIKAKSKNFNLTPEEFYRKRGGFNFNSSIPEKDLPKGYKKDKDGKIYDQFGVEVKTDLYLNITNLGTYFGYGLGYMASVYSLKKKVQSAENDKTEGFKQYFDIASISGTVASTMFRQTPSIKLVKDILDSANEDARKQGQDSQILANITATLGSVLSPSIFGKPLSQAEGETVQPYYEIESEREDLGSIGKMFMQAHLKLSRNGFLGMGLGRSELYKPEIGLFGEDLTARKTISEPGLDFSSYMESLINFPSMKIGTEGNVSKMADEMEKQQAIRQWMIDTSYLATVYAKYGGDANRYWRILDRPRKNAFVLTETEEMPLTGENLDQKFKLPNDIYRDELRILGEKMWTASKNYISGYSLEKIKDLVRGAETEKEAMGYIEQWFSELEETFQAVETEYKQDFLANRANGILRTMKDRGLLTDADMVVLSKMYEQTNLENILNQPEQARWEATFDKKK